VGVGTGVLVITCVNVALGCGVRLGVGLGWISGSTWLHEESRKPSQARLRKVERVLRFIE
jgi:hypothetical protein